MTYRSSFKTPASGGILLSSIEPGAGALLSFSCRADKYPNPITTPGMESSLCSRPESSDASELMNRGGALILAITSNTVPLGKYNGLSVLGGGEITPAAFKASWVMESEAGEGAGVLN